MSWVWNDLAREWKHYSVPRLAKSYSSFNCQRIKLAIFFLCVLLIVLLANANYILLTAITATRIAFL